MAEMKVIDKNLVEGMLPLGPLQQGILFHYLMKDTVDNYFQQPCYTLKGDLDIPLFERAWNQVIKNNEALRTIYRWENLKNPVQITLKEHPIRIERHDLRVFSSVEQEKKLVEIKEADRAQQIDLANGPTMRLLLCQLAEDEYELIWSHHHIILDGWCLGVIFKEVFLAYQALRQGKRPSLVRKAKYAHYLKWIQKQDQTEGLNFWKKYLQGFDSVTQLPVDFKRRGAVERADTAKLAISPERTEGIREFARKQHITVNVFIQALWALILQRFNQQDDVVFGATVSGRPPALPGVEEIVGLFINTVPVRAKTVSEERVTDFLTRLNQENIARQNYEYITLSDIKGQSEVKGQEALFESIVVYENYPVDRALAQLDLGFTIQGKSAFEMTNYDITVLGLLTDELVIEFIYNSDVLREETILRFCSQMDDLVDQILENPEKKVAELTLLTPAEEQKIMTVFNDTQTEYPRESAIHQLFEEQVAKNPEKVALRMGSETMTYGELNTRSNQIARYLRQVGVEAESLVGIMVERSFDMVSGILGILKAGGAYVPLDPAYPGERLAFMLDDTQARVLLAQSALQEAIPVDYTGEIIYLDQPLPYCTAKSEQGTKEIAAISTDILPGVIGPTNLGYIMYTSGSTGRPKGVMVEQRNVIRLVKNTNYLQLDENERILQGAPYSFDASTLEIWGALLCGGELCLVEQEKVFSMPELAKEIQQQKITTLWLTSSLFNRMIDEVPTGLKGVKHVLAGGEALSVPHVEKALSSLPGTQLINGYGPTENTTFTCCHLITEVDHRLGSIPIGSPIANTRVYILDEYAKEVPIGFPGELCIAGDGLARGYLNRPDLTAEKFIPNPLVPGERIYRSGDLARWLPDGTIEFLGRIDDQVKIRGFRIEPGEIEACLLKHPEILKAVVLAKVDSNGGKYLVAYLESERDLPIREIRTYLLETMPDYMVPAVCITLPKLPLNPNGKIDRKALPEPDGTVQTGVEYVPPTNETEEKMAAVWAEVLGTGQVGIDDNFFDLGGDSIKAIQVVSRVGKLGVSSKVKDIFAHQTIRQISLHLQDQGTEQSTAEQAIISGEVELNPVQRWFIEQDYKYPEHWNQSILLKVDRKIEVSTLQQAFTKLIEQHDLLRANYDQNQGMLIHQNKYLEDKFPIQLFDLSSLSDEEQDQQLFQLGTELKSSLNLADGLLIRVGLFDLGKRGQRLLITAHHLVIDGVSWRIILEDLEDCCQHLLQGQKPELPIKTNSFKEWTAKLLEYSTSPELAQEVEYWKEVEAKIEPLPTDSDETGLDLYESTEIYQLELTPEETQQLLTKTSATYHTEINDLLLGALARTITSWTKQDEVVIKLEGHGREEIFADVDISRTVGWFTTMYPVCLNLAGLPTLADQIKGIKEQLRAIPNKGFGYGVAKYLKQDTILSRQDELTGISYNYLGQLDGAMTGGLFTMASESSGQETNGQNRQLAMLDFTGMVVEGKLQISLGYSQKRYSSETIQNLLHSYLENLRQIIDHCSDLANSRYTPSDFPLARVNQFFLDQIPTEEVADLYGVSPMQEGMLYHHILDPKATNYLEQFCFTIEGEFALTHFAQAWNHVIDQNPILRTIFQWKDLKKPIQVVLREMPIRIHQHDLTHFSPEEQSEALDEIKLKDQDQQFDLEQGPNLRVQICQLGEEKCEVIWTFHHILLDGWCLSILFKELFTTYLHLQKGQAVPGFPKYHYKDYIQWLQKQDQKKADQFWREYLTGLEIPTSILADHRKDGLVKRVDRQELQLSTGQTARLEKLAKQEKITVNTLVQGIWALLLQKYNNTDDVLFGATVSGRPAEITGIEEMIGLFINTVPVRVQLQQEESFIQLVKRIYQEATERKEYEYTPLVQIMEQCNWHRSTPLFDNIIAFENYPLDSTMRQMEGDFRVTNAQSYEMTNYDLTLIATLGRELKIEFIYNQQLFNPETITRLIDHFTILVVQVMAQPALQIREMTLVTDLEEGQLLYELNQTTTDYPREKSIQQLFEEQVEQYPTKVAVVADEVQLTYTELNQKANQLAYLLQNYGVKPEALVGLMVERSVEMVIGTLAIIKAGGAYVPIDPGYPEERITFMLEDTAMPVILTQDHLLEMIPASYEGKVISLDQFVWGVHLEKVGNAQPGLSPNQSNPAAVASPENLAYIMYTSGSTGQPKGVMVEHRNVVRLVKNTNYIELTSEDRLIQAAPYSFDAATLEIWGALLCGGELHLISKEKIFSMTELAHEIEQKQITTVWLTSSLFNRMIDEAPEGLAGVKNLLAGGEALSVPHIQKALTVLPETRLINGYGPTENTTFTCCYTISQVAEDQVSIPIGRPIANTKVYIMDEDLRLVPYGVPGELCIGGDGLARGYLNRPDLSAEKFVVNPYIPTEKIYRSGDLVRYLPDGNIEFLGRIDQQVKIRGFRIEPGEIENILLMQSEVQKAVVIPKVDQQGDKYLVAYLEVVSELTVGELRAYLLERLPEYMVPTAFVQLAQLPLSPNGKVDRQALPEPEGMINTGVEYVAPRNELEAQIAELWSTILSVEQVGIDDDFFDLGGHSLKMIQLMSEINQLMGKDYPLSMFYENPTIRGLVTAMEEDQQEGQDHVVLLREGTGSKNIFCIHPGDGIIDYYIPLAEQISSEYSVYGLHARGLIDQHPLPETMEEMAQDYLNGMKKIQPTGPYTIIGWCIGSAIGYEIVHQLLAEGDRVATFIIMDARALHAPSLDPEETVRQDYVSVVQQVAASSEEVQERSLHEIIDFIYDQNLVSHYDQLESISKENLLRHTEIRKNLIRICNQYQPRSILNEQLYYIKAEETNVEFVDWESWQKWSTVELQHWVVPGGHMSMLEEPNVREVARIVNQVLV